ncbi:hypothetical protein BC827DRAFT_1387314 [Russula dissimulans]|nr:hypothetical protein BC827DRAFT_1387314 [Russula dissimulans]
MLELQGLSAGQGKDEIAGMPAPKMRPALQLQTLQATAWRSNFWYDRSDVSIFNLLRGHSVKVYEEATFESEVERLLVQTNKKGLMLLSGIMGPGKGEEDYDCSQAIYSPGAACEDNGTKLADVPTEGINSRGLGGTHGERGGSRGSSYGFGAPCRPQNELEVHATARDKKSVATMRRGRYISFIGTVHEVAMAADRGRALWAGKVGSRGSSKRARVVQNGSTEGIAKKIEIPGWRQWAACLLVTVWHGINLPVLPVAEPRVQECSALSMRRAWLEIFWGSYSFRFLGTNQILWLFGHRTGRHFEETTALYMKFKGGRVHGEVGKCQVRAPLIPVLAVIKRAQGPAYQHARRVCHRRRPVQAHIKHPMLVSVLAEGAISRLRRHCPDGKGRRVRAGSRSTRGWREEQYRAYVRERETPRWTRSENRRKSARRRGKAFKVGLPEKDEVERGGARAFKSHEKEEKEGD